MKIDGQRCFVARSFYSTLFEPACRSYCRFRVQALGLNKCILSFIRIYTRKSIKTKNAFDQLVRNCEVVTGGVIASQRPCFGLDHAKHLGRLLEDLEPMLLLRMADYLVLVCGTVGV